MSRLTLSVIFSLFVCLAWSGLSADEVAMPNWFKEKWSEIEEQAALKPEGVEVARRLILNPEGCSLGVGLNYIFKTVLVMNESQYDETLVKKYLRRFNETFRQCRIRLDDQIPVILFRDGIESSFEPYFFTDESYSYSMKWLHVLRYYGRFAIPTLFVNDSKTEEGQLGFSFKRDGFVLIEDQKKEVPARAIVMFNPNRDSINQFKVDLDILLDTFPHEVGHILFDEGHSDEKKNLLFGGSPAQGTVVNWRRNRISESQCGKAQLFLSLYPSFIAPTNFP